MPLRTPELGSEVGEVGIESEFEVVGHFVVGVVHEEHGWGVAESGGVVEIFHGAIDAEKVLLWQLLGHSKGGCGVVVLSV